jgi:5,10-methylenetetrahydromethanopterin reductase
VWVQLCRAAERTSTIGLGPGVLIPSLRHPMVTAAAIGTLADIAGPDRVAVGVGTGFTGRVAMGQRPLRWSDVATYIETVKGLLRGEVVTWDGGRIQMLQPEGFGPARPIDVPFLLAVAGPKGQATARDIADGVLLAAEEPVDGVSWQALLLTGTVVRDGEDRASARIVDAAGHGVAIGYHYFAENRFPEDLLPGFKQWLTAYDDVPADERHLAMHDLHLIGVNERDRPFITAEVVGALGYAWTAPELRDRLAGLEAAGITDVAYQPAGDIPTELEAFATAVDG